MTYNPAIHHRRSIRLQDYDYSSAGAYFVTIRSWNRECLFGDVTDESVRLNDFGMVVDGCWRAISMHFPSVELDEFVIMPDHLHGIMVLVAPAINPGAMNRDVMNLDAMNLDVMNLGAMNRDIMNLDVMNLGVMNLDAMNRDVMNLGAMNRAPTTTVGGIVRAFKARCTHGINEIRINPGGAVWQRNYHERIIRNDRELNSIREYIVNNPQKWADASNNPSHHPMR